MADVILCVLSYFGSFYKDKDKTIEKSEIAYRYGDDLYTGIQTNVGPVKCLLDRHGRGAGAMQIECLCSRECLKGIDGGVQSTYEYFEQQILEYCEDWDNPPNINLIAYDPLIPEQSLPCIIKDIEPPATVHIDLTGGGRNAAILLTFAAQLLELSRGDGVSAGVRLGTLLYGNIMKSEGLMVPMNGTFDLVKLIRACDAFTAYGKADKLCAYFGGRALGAETRRLVEDMQRFSDALTLNRVEDVLVYAKKVLEGFASVEETVGKYTGEYNAAMRDKEEMDYAPDRFEVGRREKTERFLKNLRYGVDEMLFATLVPSIRESFVKDDAGGSSPEASKARLIVETIRWCVDHQLIEQALSIYVERYSLCALRFGIVRMLADAEGEFVSKGLGEKDRENALNTCLKAFKLRRAKGGAGTAGGVSGGKRYGICRRKSWSVWSNAQRAAVKLDAEKIVRIECGGNAATLLAWYLYITRKRNLVVHVGSVDQKRDEYVLAYEVLGKGIEAPGAEVEGMSVDVISDEIRRSLDFLCSCKPTGGRAAATAPGAPAQVPVQVAPGGPRPICSLEELLKRIREYMDEEGISGVGSGFKLNEGFKNWVEKRKGLTYSRKTLGLGEDAKLMDCVVAGSDGLLARDPKDSQRLLLAR